MHMELIYLILGIVLGGVIGWFLAKNKAESPDTSEFDKQNQKLNQSEKESAVLKEQNSSLEKQLDKSQWDLEAERNTHNDAQARLAKAEEAFDNMREKFKNQQADFDKLQEKFTKDFQLVADRILKENSSQFSKSHQEKLDLLLKPLKERIQLFEQKIDKSSEERNSLKGEIKALVDLNQKMSNETKNLTNALKGDNKKQGNWGEFVLEKILENSGLNEGSEYKTQHSTTNDEGSRLQPDIIINLPDDKHIVIDSKVSLVHYEAFVNEDDSDQRAAYLKMLCNSTEQHIKGLHSKNYQNAKGVNSPDFVLLFMPMESVFSVCIQAKPELYNIAWDRKIILVSPTTLLATLRTIASIWKQERQTQNALKIAQESGKLFDKFTDFVKDMQAIGIRLDQTNKTYDDAMKKLSTGRGNLVKKAQDLKIMGAKASKELDTTLVENALEEVHDNDHEQKHENIKE